MYTRRRNTPEVATPRGHSTSDHSDGKEASIVEVGSCYVRVHGYSVVSDLGFL
jgi:hypothetical protein